MNLKPYDVGFMDYFDGRTVSANPHVAGTDAWYDFRRGWYDAQAWVVKWGNA